MAEEIRLTARERAALVAVLREIKADEIPQEKRRYDRKNVLAWTRVKPVKGTMPGLLKGMLLRDVSPGGLGFTSFNRMDKGQEFVLEVNFCEGGVRAYLCQVTRGRISRDGMFLGGAKFLASAEKKKG